MSRTCLIWPSVAHFIRRLRIVDELGSILIYVSILGWLGYYRPPNGRWYIGSLVELVLREFLRHRSM